MAPLDNNGKITSFNEPRHGFPLTAGGIVRSISSLVCVDDANRYIAIHKSDITVEAFFTLVQTYCDLLADLSLVIKMGRNVKKSIVRLYNIPEGIEVSEFTSIAWSYKHSMPTTGIIPTIIVRHDTKCNLLKLKR